MTAVQIFLKEVGRGGGEERRMLIKERHIGKSSMSSSNRDSSASSTGRKTVPEALLSLLNVLKLSTFEESSFTSVPHRCRI